MNYRDYIANVRSDCYEYIDDNFDPREYTGRDLYEFFDDMELVVTGNDNGSYYCSTYMAEQAVSGVVFDNDFLLSFRAYGLDDIFQSDDLIGDPERFDVIVRYTAFQELYSELENYCLDLIEDVSEEEE